MNILSFIFGILCLLSFDILFGFIIYNFWKYFDMKYFSKMEINLLKQENEYLKKENKKVNGSSDFWE